jgi:preprotein translocase subunit SecG
MSEAHPSLQGSRLPVPMPMRVFQDTRIPCEVALPSLLLIIIAILYLIQLIMRSSKEAMGEEVGTGDGHAHEDIISSFLTALTYLLAALFVCIPIYVTYISRWVFVCMWRARNVCVVS